MTWILVTGGAKRLGAAICESLSRAGYNIVVHYRSSKEDAEKVMLTCKANGVNAEILYGDFSTPESTQQFIEAYLKKYSATYGVVNNVGNYPQESALETSALQWNELFQTNLHAPFAIIHALIPSLVDSRGTIINIGISGINAIKAAPKATAYRTTKMSLLFLTKSLARELAPSQVNVNMVSPGQLSISSDLPTDFKSIPMMRFGALEEVTRVILFLADPKNRYITGQNIEVAGGLGL